ncbi:MAG: LysM peptidoglycan-binding domain-containing protein, partial [Planctomycetes bacterium]|nr:LysM peptidoglycan-binding domain-containing protein [Planctomycetota bacterium]
YQVRGGDTLFGIARKTYCDGSHWKRIMQANRMASPAALAVGQKLLIPPLAETHTAWNR